MGATSPDKNWYFVEGTTQSGFETCFCVMNPNDDKANVNINYTIDDGTSFLEKIKVRLFAFRHSKLIKEFIL